MLSGPEQVPLIGTKRLTIGHERLCLCSPKHINCLTAKEWTKAQVGVWQFYYNGRDIRDKNIHPAVFPISLARRVIDLFTHRGELCVDHFAGTGTTLIAARDAGRNAIGFDISEKYVEFANQRLKQEVLTEATEQTVIRDDARNLPEYFSEDEISLFFTSPPYANLLNRPRLNKSRRGDLRKNGQYLKVEQYSQDPRDLGTLPMKEYVEQIMQIYKRSLPLLKPRGHAVIDIPDVWSSDVKYGRRVPLHIGVHEAMIRAGYELRNIIIWDRNPIVNRIGIIGWPSNYITLGTTFEYLLDFWRPPIDMDA